MLDDSGVVAGSRRQFRERMIAAESTASKAADSAVALGRLENTGKHIH